MTCGLVHTSYSLPEWQAAKLTFFAPCRVQMCFALTTSMNSKEVQDLQPVKGELRRGKKGEK